MSLPPVSAGAIGDTTPSKGDEPRLRGGRLFVARGVWLLLSAGMLANFIASIPAYYAQQHVICDAPVHCIEADQATPGKLLALERLGLSLDDFALYSVYLQIVVALVFLAMGALLFWRRSHDRLGLLASFFLVLLGCSGTLESLAGAFATADSPLALRLLALLIHGAELPALGVFLLLFPTGRFTPRWTWIVSLWWTAHILSFNAPAPYNFNYWPPLLQAADVFLLLFGSALAIQVYRYRRVYTPIERQQTKWLVVGFATGMLLFVFFGFALPIVPGLNAPDSPAQLLDSVSGALLFMSIPVGVGIAILRYRLWDIDAIINKALVYGTLTALLAGVYTGLIIGLESLIGLFTGQAPQPVVIVVSTLAIAALVQPLRRRIQHFIDRRFYRRKYDATRTLAAFSATLRQEVHLEQLRQHLLAVVQETMQPAHISLWLRSPERHPTEQAHSLEPHDATATVSDAFS